MGNEKITRGKSFTVIEDEVIENDRAQDKTIKEIVEHLANLGYERTVGSVTGRIKYLIRNSRIKAANPQRKSIFTQEQDERIIRLANDDYSYSEIAEMLSSEKYTFSADQIRGRAFKLRANNFHCGGAPQTISIDKACDYLTIVLVKSKADIKISEADAIVESFRDMVKKLRKEERK